MKLAAIILALWSATAHADDRPDGRYFYSGGAVPLFWVPLATAVTLKLESPYRAQPWLFSASEGGESVASWEVPEYAITTLGAGVALVLIAYDDDSRWNHVKGMAETMATTAAIVAIAKPVFSRHRPDWTAASQAPSKNESFPSGHTATAFAVATYTALYLHDHDDASPFAYAGLAAGAILLGGERVYHHRHHLTDVLASTAIGTVTAALIYNYQQGRTDVALQATSHSLFSFGGQF